MRSTCDNSSTATTGADVAAQAKNAARNAAGRQQNQHLQLRGMAADVAETESKAALNLAKARAGGS